MGNTNSGEADRWRIKFDRLWRSDNMHVQTAAIIIWTSLSGSVLCEENSIIAMNITNPKFSLKPLFF